MMNKPVLHVKRNVQTEVDIPLTLSEIEFLLDDCENPDALEKIGRYALRLADDIRKARTETRTDFYSDVLH